jgi:hypothetical protein
VDDQEAAKKQSANLMPIYAAQRPHHGVVIQYKEQKQQSVEPYLEFGSNFHAKYPQSCSLARQSLLAGRQDIQSAEFSSWEIATSVSLVSPTSPATPPGRPCLLYRSCSTMSPHRLGRSALHLPARRSRQNVNLFLREPLVIVSGPYLRKKVTV